jgi:hypothetical protein
MAIENQAARPIDPDGAPASSDRGHIFIAGTGRSGTSFLVRYLTELGLDTHISRRGEDAFWDDAANAGFEDMVLATPPEDLPYVLKSPWLYQYVGEVIEKNIVRIEVVIIPVRDLADAATSRSLVELTAIHKKAPWMATLDKSWEHWGHTPGGMVFSLNPMDQARLLAVGFHILVETLVRADIPILFLEFPRLAEDAAYLFSKLQPWLPASVGEDRALAAHRIAADVKKIRVRQKAFRKADDGLKSCGAPSATIAYDDHTVLDGIALRRELERLRRMERELTIIYASRPWKVVRSLRKFAAVIRALMSKAKQASDGIDRRDYA